MVFVATVVKQLNKNTVVIDCPDLNIVGREAQVCSQAGVLPQYFPDDVVLIGREENSSDVLVVFGNIYSEGKTASEINSSTFMCNSNFKANGYPTIGNITPDEFSHLKNLNTKLDVYFNDKEKENSDRLDDVSTLKLGLSGFTSDLSNSVSNMDILENDVSSSSEKIGTSDSISNDNLCGILNNDLRFLNDANQKVGDVKNSSLKQLYNEALELANSFGVTQSGASVNLSGMLQRAEEMVNYAWTAKSTFHIWNSDSCFIKGKQYKGVPYTLSVASPDFNSFKTNKDNNSDVTVNGTVGPKYGLSCAIFVSIALGLNPYIYTVTELRSSGNLQKLDKDQNKVSNIQPGDVLIRQDGAHAMWVGKVTDSYLTIYEESSVVRDLDNNGILFSGAIKREAEKVMCTANDGRYANLGNANYIFDVYRPLNLTENSIGNTPVADSATFKSILEALKKKFPHGKYWNHANNPGNNNNQDGYTDIPCHNYTIDGGSQTYGHHTNQFPNGAGKTCNGFQPPGSGEISWQCMGFADKLGYDLTGYNPKENGNADKWKKVYNFKSLKPGDIIRIGEGEGHHSIFVTEVNINGSQKGIKYADCNSDGHCIIRWNAVATVTDTTITRDNITEPLTVVRTYTGNDYNNSPMLKK